MRSIRRAAIAGATAASLILGAASVATAEETNDGLSSNVESVQSVLFPESNHADLSTSLKTYEHRVGKALDADKPADGRALFGSTTDLDSQPAWARYFNYATIIGLVGAFFGLVVFPAYNFAVANKLIVK